MAINGIEMITDRSISDVVLVKSFIKKGFKNMTEDEKKIFLSGMKGSYNYKDFNRVESCVEYLSQKLIDDYKDLKNFSENIGVPLDNLLNVPYNPNDYEGLETKTNWEFGDLLSEYDRNRYINNVILIIKSYSILSDEFPLTLKNLTYSKANEIEKSLENTNNLMVSEIEYRKNLILNVKKSWFYSGDFYGGEI